MVAPYGSYEALFGTNPFTIGIPTTPRPQVKRCFFQYNVSFFASNLQHKSERVDVAECVFVAHFPLDFF